MLKIFGILLLIFGLQTEILACTSAIITGKATKDGRPLLWKHRDTDDLRNKIVSQFGPRHLFYGIYNVRDSLNRECFMGANIVGFAIINTAAYNLKYPKYEGKMDEEGILMREALGTCRTLEDFELLLEQTKGKRGVEANFGVIDANGGAAYYETTPYSYVKFDANDSSIAPHGYLIRTNYCESGAPDVGSGYVRYETASRLFAEKWKGGEFDIEFILLNATRSLKHSLVGIDLAVGQLPPDEFATTMVPFRDFIPRHSTSSSLVIQGVKSGEDPIQTLLWTLLGFPLTTVLTPVWILPDGYLPEYLVSKDYSAPWINLVSLELKSSCFPYTKTEGTNYIDLSKVVNRKRTGYLQRVLKEDEEIIKRTKELRDAMQGGGFSPERIRQFYSWNEKRLRIFYGSK